MGCRGRPRSGGDGGDPELEQAPPTGLRPALAEGAAAGLVAATAGGDYAFVHDLVREVLYDGLDPTARADLHRRTGTASLTAGDLPHARAAFERAARSARAAADGQRLAQAAVGLADEARRRSLGTEAVAVARAVGDPGALGYALAAACDAEPARRCDRCSAAAVDVVRLGGETGDRQLELLGLRLRIVALLEIGDIGARRGATARVTAVPGR